MNIKSNSIRTFIGSKNYTESQAFYQDLGFEIVVIDSKMCLFKVNDNLAFYLQDAYVKEWIENSMIFLEVEDVHQCLIELQGKKLPEKYPTVRLSEIRYDTWGNEIFMHDPAGVLWHFGEFK